MVLKTQVLLFFQFLLGVIIAQQTTQPSKSAAWHTQEVKVVDVTAKFPTEPRLEKKEIYTKNGVQTLFIYTATDIKTGVNYVLNYRSVVSAKKTKALLEEEVQRLAIAYSGYPVVKSGSYKGFAVNHIEIQKPDKSWVNISVFIYNNFLLELLVERGMNSASVGTYFFNTLSFGNSTNMASSSTRDVSNPYIKKKNETWVTLEKEDHVISFPANPFYRGFYFEKNTKMEGNIDNYYYLDKKSALNFLLSIGEYKDSTKYPNALFDLAIRNIVSEYKANVLEEKKFDFFKYPCKEYLLQAGKAFYRIRYYIAHRKLYQLIIRGDKKSIYTMQNEKFFSGFKVN